MDKKYLCANNNTELGLHYFQKVEWDIDRLKSNSNKTDKEQETLLQNYAKQLSHCSTLSCFIEQELVSDQNNSKSVTFKRREELLSDYRHLNELKEEYNDSFQETLLKLMEPSLNDLQTYSNSSNFSFSGNISSSDLLASFETILPDALPNNNKQPKITYDNYKRFYNTSDVINYNLFDEIELENNNTNNVSYIPPPPATPNTQIPSNIPPQVKKNSFVPTSNNTNVVNNNSNNRMDVDKEDDVMDVDGDFKSAKIQLIENEKKAAASYGTKSGFSTHHQTQLPPPPTTSSASTTKPKVTGKRKFISPLQSNEEEDPISSSPPNSKVTSNKSGSNTKSTNATNSNSNKSTSTSTSNVQQNQSAKKDETNPSGITHINGVPLDDEKLRNLEPALLERIINEILDSREKTTWDNIAGLQDVKDNVQELITMPLLRPELFTGLRTPPKGLLLFGPPGTGKTMIGRAIANEVEATFFSISASSLTSKWIGEGEKMVRALFAVARCYSASVIFIDEIDSLLSARAKEENEASRRIKTEFLVQMEGVGGKNASPGTLLLIGATNRPEELDDAVRRRLERRLYVPLPDLISRTALLTNLICTTPHNINRDEIEFIAKATGGYSGADIQSLCSFAAMAPLRENKGNIRDIRVEDVRKIEKDDFLNAIKRIKPSVDPSDLDHYIEWDKKFGQNF